MQRKTIASILIFVGAIVVCVAILRGFKYTPTGEKDVPDSVFYIATSSSVSEGQPIRIIIPKINVDTEVEHVGITYKGNMSTPKDISHAGWYKYGTIPGSTGSAVIDGHVDNGFNLPGVFVDLKKLEKGDDVYVQTDDGKELHFIVTDSEVYPYMEVPLSKLFTKNDVPRLNLITCEGDWIPEAQTDDSRRVVYTTLVKS